MSNILVRSLTGAVFISLILIPLFWMKEVTAAVFGLFMVLGLIEFYKLFSKSLTVDVRWEVGLFYGLMAYGISAGILLNALPGFTLIILLPLLFLLILLEIWRKKENPLLNVSVLIFGITYVTLPFILMLLIHQKDHASFPLLAGMFILIWMNDTFAYLSGRFFGKTKLIERISPKKTWEGTVGGIVFTVAAGFAVALLFDQTHLLFWVISALIIAPCSILGDLLESLFKRNMGVKDSGNLLPGHGGILDRFDATLFTVPFFMTWVYSYSSL